MCVCVCVCVCVRSVCVLLWLKDHLTIEKNIDHPRNPSNYIEHPRNHLEHPKNIHEANLTR